MGNIVLIDSNYVLKVAMYARENDRRRTADGDYVGGVIGFLDSVLSLAERLTAETCLLVWDGGVSKRRLKRFPDYKSTRWKERAENPDALAFSDAFVSQRSVLFDLCGGLRLPWIELRDREADDVIVHIVKMLSNVTDMSKVYVASGDKDLLQSCRLGARVYRMHKKDIVTPDNFTRKIGIDVDNYILWRSIVGERQRNDVTGVPNVGEKTATMMLTQEGVNDFVSLMHYCGRKGASARERAVIEFFEVVCRNIDILDLEREIFTEEENKVLIKKMRQEMQVIKRMELAKMFSHHNIKPSEVFGFSSYVWQFSLLQPINVL